MCMMNLTRVKNLPCWLNCLYTDGPGVLPLNRETACVGDTTIFMQIKYFVLYVRKALKMRCISRLNVLFM